MSSIAMLIGRILLSVIFIQAAISKLMDVSGTIAYFQGLGMLLPSVMIWLVILIELVGGLMILTGFYTRIAATILAFFCIATAFIGLWPPRCAAPRKTTRARPSPRWMVTRASSSARWRVARRYGSRRVKSGGTAWCGARRARARATALSSSRMAGLPVARAGCSSSTRKARRSS